MIYFHFKKKRRKTDLSFGKQVLKIVSHNGVNTAKKILKRLAKDMRSPSEESFGSGEKRLSVNQLKGKVKKALGGHAASFLDLESQTGDGLYSVVKKTLPSGQNA